MITKSNYNYYNDFIIIPAGFLIMFLTKLALYTVIHKQLHCTIDLRLRSNNFQIKPYTITEFYKCINSKGKNNEPVVVLRLRTLLTFKNFFHSNFIIILYNFFITFLWLYTSHSFFSFIELSLKNIIVSNFASAT